MKTLTTTLIAVTFGLLAASPVFASHGEGRGMKQESVHARLDRQDQRIKVGLRERQLTRKEAKTLKSHQRDIRYLLRLFSDDGRLSKREWRILERELNHSSQQIKRLRHNDLERYVDLHQRSNQPHYRQHL